MVFASCIARFSGYPADFLVGLVIENQIASIKPVEAIYLLHVTSNILIGVETLSLDLTPATPPSACFATLS